MSDKPHKGTLTNWWKQETYTKLGLGFVIRGTFDGHPQFHGETGHTSFVIAHDETTGEIETRNSRYTLNPPAQKLLASQKASV